MKKLIAVIILASGLALLFGFSGCTSRPVDIGKALEGPQPANRVSVMAFNVENLFDTKKDADRNDFTFLPLTAKKDPTVLAFCAEQRGFRQKECKELNWDEATLNKKKQAIRDAVLQVYGKGPDVLILVEVENIGILNDLADTALKDAGYTTRVLIEGDDKRGIDIGLLSRFPLRKKEQPTLHRIEFRDGRPSNTRGILDVPLELPGGFALDVLGVHFPSQSNPTAEREDAVATLAKVLDKKPKDRAWIVGGDWNITTREDQGSDKLIRGIMVPRGSVSHIIGCKKCPGTHNHKGRWDFLDILVFGKVLSEPGSAYTLDADSIQVPARAPGQLNKNGIPDRFEIDRASGPSDHLPIYAELVKADLLVKEPASK